MTIRSISVLAVILFSSILFSTFAAENDSTYDLEKSFNIGPGKRVTIDLGTGGDISVSGSSSNNVTVRGTIEGPDAEDVNVDFRETASGLEISSEYTGGKRNYNSDVTLEITVPSRFDVAVDTTGGEVHIDGVEGAFSGRTMGGRLDLANLKGDISLTTMGGDILLADSELDGNVKTMGGEVVLRNVSGSVKGSTMGGKVHYENSNPSGKAAKPGSEVVLHTMGGDLELGDAPNGAKLETMGGDIRVRSAKHHVYAKTMGGDIEVLDVDGRIDATTMGGDVRIRMTGDPAKGERDAEITSLGGDIELTVPDGLEMTIDLEVAYERNSRRPTITSDFDVDQEDTESEDSNGRWKRVIRATGKTGAGTHRVKIRTIDGNIKLKRG